MTNYMELIMTSQPWHLLFFMAIPVILAESLVVTEFYCLFRGERGIWSAANKFIGVVVGIYFAAVFVYLSANVLPAIEWRGTADKIAIVSYLAGVVPLLSITLLELGVVGKNLGDKSRRQVHCLLLTGFLVVSHIAMIFGMTEPQISEMPMSHEHHEHGHH